jgi:hypothetical protein
LTFNEASQLADQIPAGDPIKRGRGEYVSVAELDGEGGELVHAAQCRWQLVTGGFQQTDQLGQVMRPGEPDSPVRQQGLEQFFGGLLAVKTVNRIRDTRPILYLVKQRLVFSGFL